MVCAAQSGSAVARAPVRLFRWSRLSCLEALRIPHIGAGSAQTYIGDTEDETLSATLSTTMNITPHDRL